MSTPWQELATAQGFASPKDWLTHLTVDRDLHQHEAAAEVGVDLKTLRRALARFDVPRKPRGGSRLRLSAPFQDRVTSVPGWQTLPLKALREALGGGDLANICHARKKQLEKMKGASISS